MWSLKRSGVVPLRFMIPKTGFSTVTVCAYAQAFFVTICAA